MTGRRLLAEVDGQLPGFQFSAKAGKQRRIRVEGNVFSEQPVSAVEIILNGEVAHHLTPVGKENRDGTFEVKFAQTVELTGSGWVAVRSWEPRPGGRVRFAHTAPSFFTVPNEPLRPRKEEIAFLIQRVQGELPCYRHLKNLLRQRTAEAGPGRRMQLIYVCPQHRLVDSTQGLRWPPDLITPPYSTLL